MSDLVIEKERAYIRNGDGVFKLGTTKNALGNVIEMLEDDFPGEYTAQFAATAVLNELNGKGSTKDIFGFRTSPAIMLTVSGIVDGRDQIAIDLKDVERLRIEQRISIAPQPVSRISSDAGLIFEDVHSVIEVVYGLLYFYAINDWKLCRCAHCHRWFAAKTFREKYCSRISPCYGMIVSGKKLLGQPEPCFQAVKTLKIKFTDRRKCIYNNWYVNFNGDTDTLLERCAAFFDTIKKEPSVENFVAFQKYLYSDEMPRQERPNRKSNSFTRGLLER